MVVVLTLVVIPLGRAAHTYYFGAESSLQVAGTKVVNSIEERIFQEQKTLSQSIGGGK